MIGGKVEAYFLCCNVERVEKIVLIRYPACLRTRDKGWRLMSMCFPARLSMGDTGCCGIAPEILSTTLRERTVSVATEKIRRAEVENRRKIAVSRGVYSRRIFLLN